MVSTRTGGRVAAIGTDTVVIVVDRRSAENLYYALALALGGLGEPKETSYGKKGRGVGKYQIYPKGLPPKAPPTKTPGGRPPKGRSLKSKVSTPPSTVPPKVKLVVGQSPKTTAKNKAKVKPKTKPSKRPKK
jgi:hypothetical protein